MHYSTAFIQNILYPKVTADQHAEVKPILHCVRLELKYWNSVSTFGALCHFQYHRCEEIDYFSMHYSTALILYILYPEVTADQQKSNRYFHCARLESKYWNPVSTFGALLHYQYHSSEEIVYFSMDSNPDLAQYVLYTEVTANQQRRKRYFHCARLDSKYWNSVSTFGALLHFQYHISEEISTFQWILLQLSFKISYILKSRWTCRDQNDTFIVQDLIRSTENQYPLLGHFFTFSTISVKSYATFQWILLPLSFKIFYVSKSRRTCRDQNHTFIV